MKPSSPPGFGFTRPAARPKFRNVLGKGIRSSGLLLTIACLTGALTIGRPVAAGAESQPAPELVVDGASVGGTCNDLRRVEQVSKETPWCSLDRALAQAPAGSLVWVRAGSYPPAEVHRTTRSRTVTFKPHPGEKVLLGGLRVERSSGFRFEGFRFGGRM